MIDTSIWTSIVIGTVVVIAQHHCGFNKSPVNAYVDEHDNWVCPNCGSTYGAAHPIVIDPGVERADVRREGMDQE